MKKEEIHVLISNKKEVKQAKSLLNLLNEPVSCDGFFKIEKDRMYLVFSDSNDWCIFQKSTLNKSQLTNEITLKQLFSLLIPQKEKTKKIAVKVENEKEFHALMKYYDSINYVWNGGDKASDKAELPEYPNVIRYENEFQHSLSKRTIDSDGYKVIPFSELAEAYMIELPLIKSEDGVWLYEGDKFWHVMVEYMELGKLNPVNLGSEEYEILTKNSEYKSFSTEESALKWIEANKPKYQIIFDNYTTIFKDKLKINFGYKYHYLLKNEIESILKKMNELS